MPMRTTLPDSVETLLRHMVRHETVNAVISGRRFPEAVLSAELEALAQALGFATRRLPVAEGGENLLVLHEAAAAGPWLMFESHLDTVTLEGMTIDPLAGELHDGRLWGRGACDTKGTGAAMLWALRQYAARPRGEQPNNIAIAFTVDEEYGMTGVRGLIRAWPALGFKPVGVIVGEPTRLRPINAHNGAVRWRLVTHGLAAHSADPAKGRSAISGMVRLIDAIESRYVPALDARHPATGKAQCSVNLIRGGTQINIIPAQCEARIDRRIVPGEAPESVLPAVESLLREVASRHGPLEFEQELLFACPPLSDAHNAGLLANVQAALAELDLPCEAMGVPYATDAGDLDRAGIPAIVLGPGDIAQAHTRDEYLELEQLHRGVEVYEALMAAKLV